MSKEQCVMTVLRYLKDQGMVESMLAVEKQSGMRLEVYSKEIAFIRRVMLEGDFSAVVGCLQPFQSKLQPKEFEAIMFRIHRQRLFELVEEPDEIELRELLEQEIDKYCTASQYEQLFDFLTLEHVSEHPEFPNWTKLRGRNECFEYLKPSIELIESRVVTSSTQEPKLKELIDSYYNAPSHSVENGALAFSKKFNSNEQPAVANKAEPTSQKSLESSMVKGSNASFSYQQPVVSEKLVLPNASAVSANSVMLSNKFELSERLITNQSKLSKGDVSYGRAPPNEIANFSKRQIPNPNIEQEEISMTLTPSNVVNSKATVRAGDNNPILEVELAKSIKLDVSQVEKSQLVEDDVPIRSIDSKAPALDKLSRSSRDPTLPPAVELDSSKSAVVNIARPYQQEEDEPEPVEFQYNLSRNSPFEKMRQSARPTLVKLVASVSDEKAMRVCQFSESGKLFAIGTNSSRLKIYDVDGILESKNQITTELQPIYEIPNLHQKSVFSIDWSANQRYMVSCSNDSTVKLTKFDSRLESHETNVIGRHDASIRMVRFDALLTRIVSCAEDHLIKVWDVVRGKSLQVLKGHYSSVNAIRLKENENTNIVYSVSKDCSIRQWDLRTGQPQAISKPHESQMTYIARHGENLIVSHKDGTVSVYTPSLQLLENIKVHSQQVRSVECCSTQTYYLSASFDGTVCLMQRDDRERLKMTYERHNHVKQDDKVVFASFNQSKGYASCSVTGVCNIYSIN